MARPSTIASFTIAAATLAAAEHARANDAALALGAHAAESAPAAPEPPVPAQWNKDTPPPQPRDYFLSPPRGGTWLTLDAYTVGTQANLERRFVIRSDDYAAITPRVTALGSLGFGELSAHTDVRFLFFNVGVSGGVRRVWRNYAFAPGVEGTREARTAIDKGEAPYEAANWGFGEARIRMALPITDSFFVATSATARYENCPDNSFDWFHTTMHDSGVLLRYEATLLYRNPTLGAIGPSLRVLSLPRKGGYESELAGGLTFGRRVGFFKQNDLVLLNVLARPGDPSFGFQLLKSPVYALLAYRVSFEL